MVSSESLYGKFLHRDILIGEEIIPIGTEINEELIVKITENNIASVRPGLGLHPKHYDQVIGKIVNKNLKKGDRLKLEDLS